MVLIFPLSISASPPVRLRLVHLASASRVPIGTATPYAEAVGTCIVVGAQGFGVTGHLSSCTAVDFRIFAAEMLLGRSNGRT
jgi:hypothetical protein